MLRTLDLIAKYLILAATLIDCTYSSGSKITKEPSIKKVYAARFAASKGIWWSDIIIQGTSKDSKHFCKIVLDQQRTMLSRTSNQLNSDDSAIIVRQCDTAQLQTHTILSTTILRDHESIRSDDPIYLINNHETFSPLVVGTIEKNISFANLSTCKKMLERLLIEDQKAAQEAKVSAESHLYIV